MEVQGHMIGYVSLMWIGINGLITERRYQVSCPTKISKVLLVGYNGANNTGAEARLLAIIEDIRAVMGDETLITVPTLFEEMIW